MLNNPIGDRIKQERKRNGWTQQELLERIYMSPTSTASVRRWERGEIIPELGTFVRMAEAFNCDVGYLLCDYDQRKRDSVDICETTGLTEAAADTLRRFNNADTDSEGWPCSIDYTGLLSSLLTHPQFEDFLLDALQAVQHQKEGEPELSKSDPAEYKTQFSQLQVKATDLGLTFLNNRELHRFYAQEAARTMANILNDLGKEG